MFFYFLGTGRSGHVCDFHQGIANLQGSSTAAPWLFQNFAPLKPQLYETRWNEWSTSSWPSHFIFQSDLGMWNYHFFALFNRTPIGGGEPLQLRLLQAEVATWKTQQLLLGNATIHNDILKFSFKLNKHWPTYISPSWSILIHIVKVANYFWHVSYTFWQVRWCQTLPNQGTAASDYRAECPRVSWVNLETGFLLVLLWLGGKLVNTSNLYHKIVHFRAIFQWDNEKKSLWILGAHFETTPKSCNS